jgi:hypothetical protein
MFDDALLDDPAAWGTRGARLEWLALTGARLRHERRDQVRHAGAGLGVLRPRSVVVVGTEARLVRAVTEPVCPVPLVAWPTMSLPAWVGPLDLVVVLAGCEGVGVPACWEAARRGSLLFVVAPQGSPLLDEFGSACVLPTHSDDAFVAALVALQVLGLAGLGPGLDVEEVADVLDQVAEECGPRHRLGTNPAKDLACALADAVPLIWGGSVLAARASRRIAEAVREATGAPALAADAQALAPLIEASHPRDVFADPFEDPQAAPEYRLLVLDDGQFAWRETGLAQAARRHGVRVESVSAEVGTVVPRYAALLHKGLFLAAYLGLGQTGPAQSWKETG